eukprot:Gregarina_sp_Pseudo_9__3375@NODE_354_length_3082_cov_26_283273_g333_i0_p3_GENE_NODE_354_length_3082_cov_26_283273_g333_i0NODE_354_length_3082_cov_26_283273_g333_i0_p3_ORF_typecomplete_len192_score24_14_NODE_354_length_3082_cov_26_283273_g333_i010585
MSYNKEDTISNLFFHPKDFESLNKDVHRILGGFPCAQPVDENVSRMITKYGLIKVSQLIVKSCSENADGWPNTESLLAVLEREEPELYKRCKDLPKTRQQLSRLMRFVNDSNHSNPQYSNTVQASIYASRQNAIIPPPIGMMNPMIAMAPYPPMGPPMMMPLPGQGGPPMMIPMGSGPHMQMMPPHPGMRV